MTENLRKRALVILADGYEDIEAVAPIDVLTRSGVEVTIAATQDGPVVGAYGTTIVPEMSLGQVSGEYDAIILPGGLRNARALAADSRVTRLILDQQERGGIIAAICASPSHVLAEAAGILRGRSASGDPGFNDKLEAAGARVTRKPVTVDGNIITATGPGSALLFALQIAEALAGKSKADEFAGRWGIERNV